MISLRTITLLSVALASAAVAEGEVLWSEQKVPFTITTTGAFDTTKTNVWQGLTFNGVDKASYDVPFGGGISLPLGTFYLADCGASCTYSDSDDERNDFLLTLTFFTPAISNGSAFDANIRGTVHRIDPKKPNNYGGFVAIDFPDQEQVFAYKTTNGSGEFSLTLEDVVFGQVRAGEYGVDSAELRARIDASPVPEPTGAFLLGTSLLALLGVVRRSLH